jgi:hypothetical protein
MTAFASVVLPRTVAGPDGGNSIPSTFNYTTLRAYVPIVPISGGAQIYVRAPGIEGLFVYDATDTTTADNGGTIIVNATKGWRWKRQFYSTLFAEWFGASEGGTASANTTTWQAAIDATGTSTDSAGNPPGLAWAGEHTVNATLNVDLTTSRGFRMLGNGPTLDGRGSRLRAATTFTGSVLLQLQGDATALDAIDTFELDNFALLAQAGSTCTVGLKIGETAKLVDAVVTNKVTRLSVEGFPIEVLAVNARDIYWGLNTFSATGVVGGTAFRLETDSVAFQSDGHDFEGNTFVGPAGSGKCVSIYNATNGAALKGISFYGRNKLYNGATAMEINAGASGAILGDIFIGGDTQFDNVEDGIVISAAAGSTIEGVYCRGNEFTCLTANKFAFKADIAATGRVKQIEFCGNVVKYYPDQPVLLNNVDTIRHEGNEYFQVHSDTSVVKFDGCSNVVHGGNVLAKGPDGAAQYFVEFTSDCSGITVYPDQADPAALSIGVINDATYTLDLAASNWLVSPATASNTTPLSNAMTAMVARAGGTYNLDTGILTKGSNTVTRGVSFVGGGFSNPATQTTPPTITEIHLASGTTGAMWGWALTQDNGQNTFANMNMRGVTGDGGCFVWTSPLPANAGTINQDQNFIARDLYLRDFAGPWLYSQASCRGGLIENVWVSNSGGATIENSDWTIKGLKGGNNTAAVFLTIKGVLHHIIGGDFFKNRNALAILPSAFYAPSIIDSKSVMVTNSGFDIQHREHVVLGANCKASFDNCSFGSCSQEAADTYSHFSLASGSRLELSNAIFRDDSATYATLPKYLFDCADDTCIVDCSNVVIEANTYATAITNRPQCIRGLKGFSYTPTITAASGAITTSSATGQYLRRVDGSVHVDVIGVITTNGTGATAVKVSLPVPVSAAALADAAPAGMGWITAGPSGGNALLTFGLASDPSQMYVRFVTGTYPGADGVTFAATLDYLA